MKSKPIILVGLGLAATTALFVLTTGQLPSAPRIETGNLPTTAKPGPTWELKDLDGKTVKSSDFASKVVVLDFWATWCGPCRMEIPDFIKSQKQYADRGLVVIGVSLDQDGASTVKPFIEKTGVNYPIVLGDETVVSAFGGIEGIPTTFIIDREGRIVHQHVGYTSKAEFEADIKPLS